MTATLSILEKAASGSFKTTATGLVVEGEPSREEWHAFGTTLRDRARQLMWDLGDWLNYGEAAWGEIYDEAEKLTGLHYDTLAKAKQVARKFEFGRRRPNLGFTAHREVVSLSPKDADKLLDEAERKGLSSRDLRERVKKKKSSGKGEEDGFLVLREGAELGAWFAARRESWPEEHRPQFFTFVRRILQNVEDRVNANDEGQGADSVAELERMLAEARAAREAESQPQGKQGKKPSEKKSGAKKAGAKKRREESPGATRRKPKKPAVVKRIDRTPSLPGM